jgi:hypothetical protein
VFRTRLTLTQLEQRETPSDITPVDPNGGSTAPTSPTPVQTTPISPGQTTNPLDPVGTP